ncbi:TetR/AcrR family transcriptional regulator [Flammeovirga kamogawensis]|uniref:TetR/AcrR family transcriptional regulator n=1 Tax=Flammeovirga kamogawensis TaxID=373891 RepID=A0ABX8GYV8_9BACT|nr:TetR/AcrR family transcriptional regulator [Flammeovirga kamogawensis]MBB6458962.1 TetR/AcrR family transcriptional repressor of nem operon [Flammeovirga kamogawensis]QWG08537.1 TetR/AcrR family transcriptional regulator [Flammeovirga kamogawensis]TRX66829.1 TetR/AcrR family transcriptional regulator [Flammeovirga kamogawensis]
MAGRPKIFKQEEVLDKTIQLFWENGYEATSTNDLLKEVNLNKGSLYNSFKSKRELFKAGLHALEGKALDNFEKALAESEDPIQIIKNMFLGIADASYLANCKGCILGNTIIEFIGKDEEIKEIAVDYLLKLENIFTIYIRKAKLEGKIIGTQSPEFLAKHLINFWNGINVTRRVYQNKQDLLDIINYNLNFIK